MLLGLNPVAVSVTTALGAVLAMGAPLLALTVAGRPRDAVFAAFGSFAGLYGGDLPCRPRAIRLAGVGAALVAITLMGGAAGPIAGTWMWGLAIALVAAAAKYSCDAARIPAPGAWIFVFTFAAAIPPPGAVGGLWRHALLAAGGAAVAWGVALLPAVRDPLGPARRATASALDRTADVLVAGATAAPPARYLAHAALDRAVSYLRRAPVGVRARSSGAKPLCPSLWTVTGTRGPPDANSAPPSPSSVRRQSSSPAPHGLTASPDQRWPTWNSAPIRCWPRTAEGAGGNRARHIQPIVDERPERARPQGHRRSPWRQAREGSDSKNRR